VRGHVCVDLGKIGLVGELDDEHGPSLRRRKAAENSLVENIRIMPLD
jgi:hypothetical protein